jgi:ribosomal protein L10
MAKTRTQKQEEITKYVAKIKGSQAMYFLKPIGMTAPQSSSLKMKLASDTASFNVVKNTLFIRAIGEADINISDFQDSFSDGERAVLFANDDVVKPMKTLLEFITTNKDKVEIVAGYYSGKFIKKEAVMEIANLPDYNTMMAKTLATFNGVATNFVRANANSIERLLNVLNAKVEQMGN